MAGNTTAGKGWPGYAVAQRLTGKGKEAGNLEHHLTLRFVKCLNPNSVLLVYCEQIDFSPQVQFILLLTLVQQLIILK